MHTIATTVFNFSELSDAAKESARDWYRRGAEFDAEHTIDDAKQCASIIGISADQVYFSGFSSQGDGAQFTGSYEYEKGSAKAIRAHAPLDTELHRIADRLADVQKLYFYGISAHVTSHGHYSHEYCTDIDVRVDSATNRDLDDDTIETVKELLRDYMRWIYSNLNNEWDYHNSDKAVDENIGVNEYTFTETGERFG